MPRKNKKMHFWRIWLTAKRGTRSFLGNNKAISQALSTIVLSAGVLALGIAILYWAFSWGNIANLQYSRAVADSSYAVAERIGFEYISYTSSNNVLTVNIINWGRANNLSISLVYVWDNLHNYVETGAYAPSQLMNITDGSIIPNNMLNMGDEGSFKVALAEPLPPGYYNIRLVTGRGRNFDGSFITP
jgi:hypothetical protein